MGRRVSPAGPAGWTLCGPFARPRTVSSAARELSRPPGERGVKSGTLARHATRHAFSGGPPACYAFRQKGH